MSFVENKVPGLTNKTVLDAYTKLLRKATAETDKRYEEEVGGLPCEMAHPRMVASMHISRSPVNPADA